MNRLPAKISDIGGHDQRFGIVGLLVFLGTVVTATFLYAQNDPSKSEKIDVPGDMPAPSGEVSADGGEATVKEEAEDNYWESYPDPTLSVAEEVTNGIRVEDIVEPPTEYRYAAFGRSDPFVPPLILEEIAAEEIPIVSPLQRFDTNTLRVVGIWRLDSGEWKGLILTPKTQSEEIQGIVVRVGDPIGKRGGKILAIESEDVVVREFTNAPDGTRQFDDLTLKLGGDLGDDKQSGIPAGANPIGTPEASVPLSQLAPLVPESTLVPASSAQKVPSAVQPMMAVPPSVQPTMAVPPASASGSGGQPAPIPPKNGVIKNPFGEGVGGIPQRENSGIAVPGSNMLPR